MQAIQCPQCRKYTPNGSVCLGCGHVFKSVPIASARPPDYLRNPSNASNWIGLGILIFITWGAYSCVSSEPAETDKSKQLRYIALHQARIKTILKDPDSAKFSHVFVSDSMGMPLVCGLVNAKNSFGGYMGDQRFISGGTIQLIETDMANGEMDKMWTAACSKTLP